MHSGKDARTLVQCDFDGTVTEEDVSFMLLDAFAQGDWRAVHRKYEANSITVGRFNSEAFSLVKASRENLLQVLDGRIKIRPGFNEFVDCCRRKGFRLVIVSNGLDFYIKEIMKNLGAADIEVHAARTDFQAGGVIRVQYIGPDGKPVDDEFKEAYADAFLKEGYRMIYLGNGTSDFAAARKCHCVFATSTLLARCQAANLKCTPFNDFNEVTRVLERC